MCRRRRRRTPGEILASKQIGALQMRGCFLWWPLFSFIATPKSVLRAVYNYSQGGRLCYPNLFWWRAKFKLLISRHSHFWRQLCSAIDFTCTFRVLKLANLGPKTTHKNILRRFSHPTDPLTLARAFQYFSDCGENFRRFGHFPRNPAAYPTACVSRVTEVPSYYKAMGRGG
jgi:hypothetical protein